MNQRVSEWIAILVTVVGVAAALLWPFFHEADALGRKIPPGAQVVTLTGVASTGTWTAEEVTGNNYWRKDFLSARPVLQVGKPALFRLKSADVIHAFYAPGLGIERADVYPGKVVEILVTPEREGVYGYYCPTMCGDPHFGMRGVVIVRGTGGRFPEPNVPERERFWLEPPPPPEAGRAARGGWLFRQKGCTTCHGPEGRGGVPNWNYVKGTVPALNALSERMYLFFEEDRKAVVDLFERGVRLQEAADAPPVRRFNVVLAQYESIRDVIREGNPAGKKDPDGPPPPLEMPAWEYHLSAEDIDSIIAYLLTLRPPQEQG